MGNWETAGASDEWYTPKYIFDALEETFDLDVAAPFDNPFSITPCDDRFYNGSLDHDWSGFIWMNPPFGGRNGLIPWLDKFFNHGNGIALTPDRTSAPWWQEANKKSDAVLFIAGKVRFIKPDGTEGKSPSTGTTLFASGDRAVNALIRAQGNGLGMVMGKITEFVGRV